MGKPEMKRINLQIDPETYKRIQVTVQHGSLSHLMSGLIKLALDSIDREGDIMLGALISGQYKLVLDYEKAV